ncbi:hypothetical protein TOTORO_00660 [Serratia phage vB_SmaS-Totoro]|nr:hypothetical protein TOTORO_00660 [Serratia phage vB_SmaS-Totoro]
MGVLSIVPDDYKPVTESGVVMEETLTDIAKLEAKLGVVLPKAIRIPLIEKLFSSKLNKRNTIQ